MSVNQTTVYRLAVLHSTEPRSTIQNHCSGTSCEAPASLSRPVQHRSIESLLRLAKREAAGNIHGVCNSRVTVGYKKKKSLNQSAIKACLRSSIETIYIALAVYAVNRFRHLRAGRSFAHSWTLVVDVHTLLIDDNRGKWLGFGVFSQCSRVG